MADTIIKRGIIRELKVTRAGTVGNRPVYHIVNVSTITLVFPKWFTKIVNHKRFQKAIVLNTFRKLKEAMKIIGLEPTRESLFEENGYIITKAFYEGSPKDAAAQLKADLRMFNKAYKEFLDGIKQFITLLDDYRLLPSGRACFCPIRPAGRKI